MLKKLFVTAILAGSIFNVMAQDAAENNANQSAAAKVNTKDVMSYSRNSITVIPITGMTGYDAYVLDWSNQRDFDGKFDYNAIKADPLRIKNPLSKNTLDSIQKVLLLNRVPKQVVDYMLQYNGKNFNIELLEKRSLYNASDADVLKDKAARVSSLKENGKEFMKNSYLLVAGPTQVIQRTDKKGNVSYSAKSAGYVYHVDLNQELLDNIWENWLDEDATDDKIAKYENLVIGLESTATVTGASGSGKTAQEAINESMLSLYEKLESKVDKWQVVTSVFSVHPIGAKIGKKEGLKNSDKYAIFKVVEDQDGELEYKRIGFARATNIADNQMYADGMSMPCSNFYQISGRRNAKEGMFLKQNKDSHMSISVSGNLFDAYAPVNLDVQYLIKTSQALGMMQYAGISIGGDFGDDIYGDKSFWIPVSLNYGLGLHFTRWFEFQPNVGIGADFYGNSADGTESSDDESFMKKIAYFAHGGIKLGFQVYYPVQLFLRADYSYDLAQGDWYVPAEKKRFRGLSVGAGIRINF